MLNWQLMSHPLNWVTIVLMVFIGVIVLNLILTPWHSPNKLGGIPLSRAVVSS